MTSTGEEALQVNNICVCGSFVDASTSRKCRNWAGKFISLFLCVRARVGGGGLERLEAAPRFPAKTWSLPNTENWEF